MPRWIPLTAALALLLVPCDAGAGAPTETLRDAFAAVNYLLQDPQLQEKPDELLAEIRGVVSDHFDFREAARLALGREWEARTPAERDEFVQCFADLLRHAYLSGIVARTRVQGGLLVNYRDEAVEGQRAIVATTIAGRDGSELPVEYRLIQDGERWAVYDAVIDGISFVGNYRAQFARVIRTSSYAELVLQVKAKTAEVPGGPIAVAPAVAEAKPAVLAREPTVDVTGDDDAARRAVPAPAEAPPTPAAVRAPSYWIQMGAFKNADTAARLATRLLERDLPVSIDAVAVALGEPQTLLARVRVGPFVDQAQAASTLAGLRTNGYRPFIARDPD